MRKIIRLILFFFATFASLLLFFTIAAVFHLRSAGPASIAAPASFWGEFAALLMGRLSVTFYASVLLSLSYAARREISVPVSMICIFCLALGFFVGSFVGTSALAKRFSPAGENVKIISLGERGLIVSDEGAQAVLFDPHHGYPRLAVSTRTAFEYQAEPRGDAGGSDKAAADGVAFMLLKNEESLFVSVSGLANQFAAVSRTFSSLKGDFSQFLLYTATLLFLLVSTRFIMNLSSWHFANLIFGAAAFYGILRLETFIDSEQVQNMLSQVVQGAVPDNLISPGVFCFLGIIFSLIALFIYLGSNKGVHYE